MLYPLRFTPIYQTAIWGGGAFFRRWGRDLGDYRQIAESWEISGHRNGISVVASGPLAGMTLQELVADHADELLGMHASRDVFPLFVKFLDAREPLSVQVHPGREVIRKLRLQDNEKAEAWVIVDAEPGSRISLGFRWPVTRKRVAELTLSGRLEEVLHTFAPRAGDCFFIPPGMVHSMGGGIVAYEVQMCSDLTLRLYDWNRRDAVGRSRELHVDSGVLASDVLRWQVGPVTPWQDEKNPALERLLATEYFHLDRWTVKRGKTQPVGGDNRCHVLTVLEGEARVAGMRNEESGMKNAKEKLTAGQTLLLPACLPSVEIHAVKKTVMLDAYLPEG